MGITLGHDEDCIRFLLTLLDGPCPNFQGHCRAKDVKFECLCVCVGLFFSENNTSYIIILQVWFQILSATPSS